MLFSLFFMAKEQREAHHDLHQLQNFFYLTGRGRGMGST